MSISLSTLTNPATSDSVLLEAQSEADFLEPIVLFKNRATGSNAISNDATQTTANDQPLSLPLIDGNGYLYCPGIGEQGATVDSPVLPSTGDFDIEIDFIFTDQTNQQEFFAQYNAGATGRFFIGTIFNNSLDRVRLFWNGTLLGDYYGGTLVKGQRHLIRVTRIGTAVEVYLDGTGIISLTVATNKPVLQVPSRIGHSDDRGQYSMRGAIFNVTEGSNTNIDFKDTSIADGASSFDCSTGQTVTINTASGVDQARIVRRPKAVFNNSEMDFIHTNVGEAFFVCATESGVVSGVFDTSSQRNKFSGNGALKTSYRTDFLQTVWGMWPNTISDSQKQALVDYAKSKSAGKNWAGIENFVFFFRSSNLKSLDASYWDTASATNFSYFLRGANTIETLDIRGWDTSSVVTMSLFARGCTSLINISIDGNTFSDSACTNYGNAFLDTNLNQATIDDILVRINAAGTTNGTFDRTGGEYPSTTGVAAKNALQARGWSMTFSSEVLPSVLDLAPAAAYSLRALKSSEDPNVVRVRRSTDGALSNFKASEVTDGTLTSWVNTDVDFVTPTLNNGDFEDGLTGWGFWSASADTNEFYAGTQSAKITVIGGGGAYIYKNNFSLQAGASYRVGFWAKISDASKQARVEFGSASNEEDISFTSTDWEYKEVTKTATAVTLAFSRQTGSGDYTINIDNITVTQLTSDGHVTTWYDQGGSNDASQTLVSKMPLLVDGGTLVTEGGLPALDFDGVNSFVNLQHSDLYGQSVLDSYYVTSTTDDRYLYPATDNTSPYGMVAQTTSNSGTLSSNYGSPDFYANGSEITGATRGAIYTATSGGQKLVAHLGADTTDSGWSNMIFGLYNSTNNFAYDGKLQEMIFFNTDQSANRTAIETNINSHFTIYS